MLNRFLLLLNDLSPVLGTDTATEAVASAGGAAPADPAAGGMFSSIWMIVIWGAVIIGMYFLLMRPQRKREKKMKEMQASIKTGDDVITTGGFFGRVADIGEDCFIVEFGTNRGIRIPVQKSDVLGVRSPKTTPAPKESVE
jgi:preprotein translocase subunit YajC